MSTQVAELAENLRAHPFMRDHVGLACWAERRIGYDLSPEERRDCIANAVEMSLRFFDPARGVKFSTFFARAVAMASGSARKARNRRSRLKCVSITEPVERSMIAKPDRSADARLDADYFLGKLKPVSRDVVRRVIMHGETIAAVATSYGVTPTAIRQRITRALRDMR